MEPSVQELMMADVTKHLSKPLVGKASISSMAQLNIGTFCWADPGLDFSQFPIQQKIKSPLQSYFSAAKSAFSSIVLPRDSTATSSGYQPGGTLMVTTNQWASRSIGTQLLDPTGMGRCSGLSYLGK
jgi:hypothetical protein